MSANPFGFRFDNSYARLPETLFAFCDPQPVQAPELLLFNEQLAAQLGLDGEALNSDTGAALLGGNQPLPGGEDMRKSVPDKSQLAPKGADAWRVSTVALHSQMQSRHTARHQTSRHMMPPRHSCQNDTRSHPPRCQTMHP